MAVEIKRMAVLAGCTYPGTEVQLLGPVNDVSRMRNVLIDRFGFKPSNIEFLTDAPDSSVLSTSANIRSALKRMLEKAEAGDVLFSHFSGHGTRILTLDGVGEDEAIVPCDFNLILDEELRDLLKCLPKGAGFTFLSDSCISSDFIDKQKFQLPARYQPRPEYCPPRPPVPREPPRSISSHPLTLPRRPKTKSNFPLTSHPRPSPPPPPPQPPPSGGSTVPSPPAPPPPPMLPCVDIAPKPIRSCKPKYLSHDFILKYLKSLTNQDASHVGDLLGAHFGEDATPKFRKTKVEQVKEADKLKQNIVVLFSGSEGSELSVDVSENGDVFGALSNAVQLVLMSDKEPISNRKAGVRVSNTLEEQGFPLRSCLYCSYEYEGPSFLAQSM